jgi:hypothetical protein
LGENEKHVHIRTDSACHLADGNNAQRRFSSAATATALSPKLNGMQMKEDESGERNMNERNMRERKEKTNMNAEHALVSIS